MFVDESGDRILKFVSAARNLSRLGELSDEVVAIAQSSAWRQYRTAVGTDEWLESELDYFLIACELGYDDVSRVVSYTREGAQLAPLMDRDADGSRRRPLAEAAKAWHAPGAESLIERAQRLGWTRSEKSADLRAAPLPKRARARQANGMTMDQHAQKSREERVEVERRRVLDELVSRVRNGIQSDLERLYVIDQLRATVGGPGNGRPGATSAQMDLWKKDAERLNWSTVDLSREWGIDQSSVRRRIRKIR